MSSIFGPLFLNLAKTRQFKTLILKMCETAAQNTDNDLDDYFVKQLRLLLFPELCELKPEVCEVG